MALDATVGGASANSYGTVAEADTYFGERLFTTTWDGLSSADKESALIWATRIIGGRVTEDWSQVELPQDATKRILTDIKGDDESYVVWIGSPATSTQALSWPRSGIKNANGFDFPDDEIPSQLKYFQFEVALKLSVEDRTAENPAAAQGLNKLKAGPVELGWRETAPNPKLIPNALFKLLVPSWWYAFELRYQNFATIEVL